MPLLVGLTTALALLLVVFALFGGPRLANRLERYAAQRPGAYADDSPDSGPRALLERVVRGLLGSRVARSVGRHAEGRGWSGRIARDLARADVALRPGEWMLVRSALAGGLPALMLLLSPVGGVLGSPLAPVLGLVIGLVGPRLWLRRRQARRLKEFNAVLADTITLLANSLRAGSSFLQSIELVVDEARPPVSTEFARVIRDVNIGLPLDEAMVAMQRRVGSDDLDLMATAISIHHSVGGNLADILDTIALTIRERVRIKGEIRVLTAQQRLSGYVVGGLPIAIVGLLALISPRYLAPMFEQPPTLIGLPAGVVMLAFGGLMMAIGFSLIRRVVDIAV
ncbi:MAG TPA: type II secretion system F family protein [Candidatus Limnocylindria bacterium]|nr:type II secretion system F family protein [Candidatus Limnocylindria bacterium]